MQEYVADCVVCQQTKYPTSKPSGLLQPLPIPSAPWTEISMDFIVGLPPSVGHMTIFVVVDRLMKVAHFCPLKSGFTAKVVATAFFDSIVKLHGFPQGIVSDRDPLFVSNFWRQLMNHSGVALKHSSAYHSQSDGQTEVVNHCLKQYLRAFASDYPAAWLQFLPWAELFYSTSFHSAIGMTPHQALYGWNPKLLPSYQHGSASAEEVDSTLTDRAQVQNKLVEHLAQAQNRMKKFADAHRNDKAFKVGDRVWVNFHPYRQQSAAKHLSFKLSKRFLGPFEVLQHVGSVTYKLQLPMGVAFTRSCMFPSLRSIWGRFRQ